MIILKILVVAIVILFILGFASFVVMWLMGRSIENSLEDLEKNPEDYGL